MTPTVRGNRTWWLRIAIAITGSAAVLAYGLAIDLGVVVALVALWAIAALYGIACAVAWGILWLWRNGLRKASRRTRRHGVACLVVACVLVARFAYLDSVPLNIHHDMSLCTMSALDVLHGQFTSWFHNGYGGWPLLGYTWPAAWLWIFGDGIAASRMPSVMSSVLALAAAWWLLREWYGPWTAWAGVWLVGTNATFLFFSRIQAYMEPIGFQVAAVAALAVAVARHRLGWALVAGGCAAYATMMYHAGRITPILLLLIAPCLGRAWVRPTLVALATASAAVAPWLSAHHGLFVRSDQFFFWNGSAAAHYPGILRAMGWVLQAVVWRTDSSTQFAGGPLLWWPLLALVACALPERRSLGLGLWAVTVALLGGALTIDPPFYPRFFACLVPLLMLAAVGAGRVAGQFPWAGGVLGAVLIGAALSDGMRFIRHVRGQREGCVAPCAATVWPQVVIGRDIESQPTGRAVVLVSADAQHLSCKHDALRYFLRRRRCHDVASFGDVGTAAAIDATATVYVYGEAQPPDARAWVHLTTNIGQHVAWRWP